MGAGRIVTQNHATFHQLVDMNQWDKRHLTLICNSRVDVIGPYFEEQLCHLCKRWSPSINSPSRLLKKSEIL